MYFSILALLKLHLVILCFLQRPFSNFLSIFGRSVGRSVLRLVIQSYTFYGVGLGLNAQVVIFLLPHWKFFYLLVDEFYILLRIFNVLH